jgi:hypothetical protein
MESRRGGRGHGVAIIVVAGLLIALSSSLAQQTRPLTLDEILLQLESNLHRYNTQVPSFFCNEHVVSVMVSGKTHQSTVTDSVFRLKRILNSGQTNSGQAPILAESREIQAVNGTPTEAKYIVGPSILTGVFSGGLDTVSLSQKVCMSYTLQPIKLGHSGEPYIVQFATLPGSQRASGCVLKEDGTGRVLIDPATMQVTRMELTAPHHTIMPGVEGIWHISVDYAAVALGGKTFWMPTAITSRATPGAADDPTIWWYKASYSNYHKLEVTSHILPSNHSAAP